MAQEFSPDRMDALLEYAAKRMNTTPEALKAAFREGGLSGLSRQAADCGITAEDAARAQALLEDKDTAARLLQNPQVQALLRQLMGDA